MSLLTRGRHEVLVIPRANIREPLRGQKVWSVSAPPEYVRCAVQPVREWSTSEESFTDGIQMLDLRRMFTRRWPGNIDSHVISEGTLFETVGAPQRLHMSRRTRHFAITLRYIGSPDRGDLEQCATLLGIPGADAMTVDALLAAVFAEAKLRARRAPAAEE